MDVVLGVAVTGPVARLALVGSGAQGSDVLDQSVVDLADHPVETLTQTVAGTSRLLADENHRLVATRLCWPDAAKADQVRRALEDSGVHNVAVLSESQAVTALMRAAGRAGGVLVVDDETATLSFVDSHGDPDQPPTMLARQPLAGASGPDATAALDTMMARLTDQPGAPTELYLVGASSNLAGVADQLRDASTMRVEVPEDPTFALARGAALAAMPLAGAAAGDATAMAPAAGLTGDATGFAPVTGAPAEEPQLAYSMADEGEPLGADEFGPEYEDFGEDEGETGRVPLSRRSLVLGNAVIAFAVIGFASLAAAVAIAVRPTASQQPVVGHQNAAPGKFMPLLPTQQQAPVPPPPLEAPNAGFQGGVIPDSNGYIPPQLVSPGAPAPAPQVPAFVPNPNPAVPIPVPVIVPYPGWRPPYNPYPPYTPPTTSPPITTTTPPTTTLGPSTTTSPPTTTSTQPTTTEPTTQPTTTQPTTTQPHVTTTQPTTQAPSTNQAPTTQAPPPTAQAPHTQTQTIPTQTIPTQPHTQQPVTPQQPVKPLLPHAQH